MSEYQTSVHALDDKDAADIARRRAREDGYRTVKVLRVYRVGLPTANVWAVVLDVVRL